YATGNAAPIQPVAAPQSIVPDAQQTQGAQGLPQSFDDIMKAPADGGAGLRQTSVQSAAITPMPGEAITPPPGRVSRATPQQPSKSPQQSAKWTARAGEDL